MSKVTRTQGKGRNYLSMIGRVFRVEVRTYPVRFTLAFLCIIVAAVSTVFATIFTGAVIDQCITPMVTKTTEWIQAGQIGTLDLSAEYTLLGILVGVFVGVMAIGLTCDYFYQYLMAYVAQGTQKVIRDQLFNHMQDLPVSYFDSHTRGDIMSIYSNDVDTLREALSRSWPMVVNSSVTMIAVLVTMFLTNWLLAMCAFLLAIPTIFFSKAIASRSSRHFIGQQRALAEADGYVEELINGQRVVKVFNYEERNKRAFDKVNDALRVEATKANRYANILMPVVNQFSYVQYIAIALIGVGLIFANQENPDLFASMGLGTALTTGVIVEFLLLSRSFSRPMGQLAQQTNSIAMALAGLVRIFELVDTPAEQDDGYVELVNAKEGPDGNPVEVEERTGRWAWKHPHTDGSPTTYTWLRGKINFYDVDFGYVPNKIVLHNITLYAEPGQKVAFVGPTGAGKTTITNLINRFYDIADGKIRYDDININKIKKADLRRSLGMVLQETELFTGTIKENIRFGKLDATDEEVVAAAKLANADRFIQQLPQGYDTMLVKAGLNLSQGQRQLIAIARCAIADPPVMILDEATSSIDSRTEEMVQKGMDAIMKGRTVFVIAHRLSTVKNSDVIMVLENGRITERGSHDELIARQGKYYQLYTGNAIKQ